jgi:MFS family permease
MIIPELPSYLRGLGGGDHIGWIIGLFTLAALISRPYSGRLTDTIGRIPVMLIGAIVCFFLGFLYVLLPFVVGFLTLRFFHGFSTGFKPTATSAYVADITPTHRKGEAVGYLSISGSLGMSSGPAIGSFLTNSYGINAMFYASSIAALCSVAVLIGMRETLEKKQPFSWKLLKLKKEDLFEIRVFHICMVMLGLFFPYGVTLTIIPDAHINFGLTNKGLFMAALTISSLATRLIGGKFSDNYGRVPVLMFAASLSTTSMLITGYATSATVFLLGGVFLGFASGLISPSITAWVLELAIKEKIGRALASMYMALELAIGLGAVLSGLFFAQYELPFKTVLWYSALLPLYSLLYLVTLKLIKHPSYR